MASKVHQVLETKIDVRIIQEAKIVSKVQAVLETKIDVRIIQKAKMEIRIVRIIEEVGLIFLGIEVLCPTYMTHRNIDKYKQIIVI